jgi:hypothetical protein
MPTLNWIDKDAVVKHHQDVPYRLLESVPALSCGDSSSGNLIVQGDKSETVAGLSPEGSGYTPNALDSSLRGTDAFGESPLMGVFEGRAIYLLYNGILKDKLKDKSVAGGNLLTGPVFDVLAPFDGPKTIYAVWAPRACSASRLRSNRRLTH